MITVVRFFLIWLAVSVVATLAIARMRRITAAVCLAITACGGGAAPAPLEPEPGPPTKTALGAPGEYKPNALALANGETLLVDYLNEVVYAYRSQDCGLTWGPREELVPGREGWLTQVSSGTIFMTAFLLEQHKAVLYRSTDNGHTWTATPVNFEDVGGIYDTETSRTIVELADGSLLWEVGSDWIGQYAWRSYDDGVTWVHGSLQEAPAGFDAVQNFDLIFNEAFIYRDGDDVVSLSRVYPMTLPALPGGYPANSDENLGTDLDNGLVRLRSHDNGETWALDGFQSPYGVTYGSMNGSMFTYTVRSLQASLGVRVATSPGVVVVIDDIPNSSIYDPSGGGFGNTVSEPDGSFITPYSYRDASDVSHVVVVRWNLSQS